MTAFPAFGSIKEALTHSTFHERVKQAVHAKMDIRKKYLVALSGGPDSVAMVVLLWALGYRIGCVHMNYHLRGQDSDADEAFCMALCNELDVPAYFKSVQLKEEYRDTPKSWQELARDLRYAFFDEVAEQHGYDFILTAHHLDDSVETFFNNLIRGTGIEGLTGIPVHRGIILRPFLNVRKADILAFLDRFSVPYRSDISNEGADYLRNQVRHRVLPAFTHGNDSFFEVMKKNMERIGAANAWISSQVAEWKQKFCTREGDSDLFSRSGFSNETPILLIYQLFKPYGFQWSEMEKMKKLLMGQAGKMISSKSYTLLVDRDRIMVRLKAGNRTFKQIDLPREAIVQGMRLSLPSGELLVVKKDDPALPGQFGKTELCIVEEWIEYPLTIRTWRPGDRFQPSGMGGRHQNVSDFLTHIKLDRFQKEKVCVLADGKRIFWVIGYRHAQLPDESGKEKACLCFIYDPA